MTEILYQLIQKVTIAEFTSHTHRKQPSNSQPLRSSPLTASNHWSFSKQQEPVTPVAAEGHSRIRTLQSMAQRPVHYQSYKF